MSKNSEDDFVRICGEGIVVGLIATVFASFACFGMIGVSMWLNAMWDSVPVISFTIAAIIGGVVTSLVLVGITLRMLLNEIKTNLKELES